MFPFLYNSLSVVQLVAYTLTARQPKGEIVLGWVGPAVQEIPLFSSEMDVFPDYLYDRLRLKSRI